MKFYASATTLLSIAPFLSIASAAASCSTAYGPKSVSSVSRTTKTVTTTYTSSRITTITSTSTAPKYTFTATVAKTTTTIPTGADFTPIISATTLQGARTTPKLRRRDAVVPNRKPARGLPSSSSSTIALAPTQFPQCVHCTTTVTKTAPATSAYSTSVVYHTTQAYATSTTHVATATVHAACAGASNMITSYHSHALSGIDSERRYDICSYSGSSGSEGTGHSGSYACLNAHACCEVAQDYFSGWRYSNATGVRRCQVLFGSYVASGQWVFYEGENDHGEFVFGNGAEHGGVFGGVNPEPGCALGGAGCSS